MPTYEYLCKDCGHALEALQGMSEPALTDCPECGRAGLERMISGGAFILKGGGWYVTDFKDGGKKKDSTKKDSNDGGASSQSDTGCGAGACPACTD